MSGPSCFGVDLACCLRSSSERAQTAVLSPAWRKLLSNFSEKVKTLCSGLKLVFWFCAVQMQCLLGFRSLVFALVRVLLFSGSFFRGGGVCVVCTFGWSSNFSGLLDDESVLDFSSNVASDLCNTLTFYLLNYFLCVQSILIQTWCIRCVPPVGGALGLMWN